MKKKVCIVILILFFFTTGNVIAKGKATKNECIKKCKQAANLVVKKGLKHALKVINDKKGPFVWKDTYVFSIHLENKTVVAHPIKPQLIGKNLLLIKDIKGKMFFSEFVNVAKKKGSGWVDYMWPKPGERKPVAKITYVYKVKGYPVLMAAGIYK